MSYILKFYWTETEIVVVILFIFYLFGKINKSLLKSYFPLRHKFFFCVVMENNLFVLHCERKHSLLYQQAFTLTVYKYYHDPLLEMGLMTRSRDLKGSKQK